MRSVSGASFHMHRALLIAVLLTAPAFPQVRGSYSPGSVLTGGGTVPDPGFSYDNQFWYITSNRLKGSHGNTLPIQGSVTFLFDNNSVVYVPKLKLLHGNLEFSLDIVLANGEFAARDPLADGPSVSGTEIGLTNTNFVPFNIGWSFKRVDLQTGYSVSAPTGRYVPGASDNVATGFWTNSWQAGATIYLSKGKATQLSVFNSYGWNTTQQGTGIRPGQNDSVDYSLTQTIPLAKGDRWPLQFGFAGYGQWQTTKASGQSAEREALLYGVDAAGFIVNISAPLKSLQLGTSALKEYHARNTFQGYTVIFNAGLTF